MTSLKKAVVKSYSAASHKAALQIAGSLAVWLDSVSVAADIPAADVVAGRECSVLFFEANPLDAVVIAINQGLPTLSGSGVPPDCQEDGLLVKADADPLDFRGGFDVLAVGSGVQISLDVDESPLSGLAKHLGRAGGQSLAGGLLPGEFLDLRGTIANLTDPVRLLSPLRIAPPPNAIIQDSAGNPRLQFNAEPNHQTLLLNLNNPLSVGDASTAFAMEAAGAVNVARGIVVRLHSNTPNVTGAMAAFLAEYTFSGTGTPLSIAALDFKLDWKGASPQVGSLRGARVFVDRTGGSTVFGLTGLLAKVRNSTSLTVPEDLTGIDIEREGPSVLSRGIRVKLPGLLQATPTSIGIDIEDQSGAEGFGATNPTTIGQRIQGQGAITTAVGLRIDAMLEGATLIGIQQMGTADRNTLAGPTLIGADALPAAGYALELRDDLLLGAFFAELREMTAPPPPAANGCRLFAEDNGAGKTRIMARFATGAAVQIAIEP